MNETGIGAAIPRLEDDRFIVGQGAFTDDLTLPGQCHAAFVRSPHVHARIVDIETGSARQAPGALAVWTAAELRAHIPNPIPTYVAVPPFDMRGTDGRLAHDAAQYPLAERKVMYLGEAVAVVVAETRQAAIDAAELVDVAYDVLAPVVTVDQALDPAAPILWDGAESNVSITWQKGDSQQVDAAFAQAAHLVRADLVNNRLAPVFMEPRGAIADHDAKTGITTLRLGCQSAHGMQAGIAEILGLAPETLRVIVADTGGGFGARGSVYPEFPILVAAARALGRPVRWIANRSVSMLTDIQSRDHQLQGELALDADGRFLGLRLRTDWRHGAYLTSRGLWVTLHFMPPVVGGAYKIAAGDIIVRGLFTNATPVGAYRGVGRAEANYLLERLIDIAARQLRIDAVELRRRNLVEADDLPWRMPGGGVLTSGAYSASLDRAVALARNWEPDQHLPGDWLHGLGVAMYVENDGSTPTEFAEAEALANGRVVIRVGTQDFGMGHTTIYAQIASDRLGLPIDAIDVVFGDTDLVKRGMGSHGSRSARMGGGAIFFGVKKMIDRGKDLAADLMEAGAADISYDSGNFRITGTDRQVSLREVAAFAGEKQVRLTGETDFQTDGDVFANGCHVARIAIDPDTGRVVLLQHVMVSDVGRAVNPLIVGGQLHGGAAQGVGQALLETVTYHHVTGQTLTGSLMDYCLPRADDLPNFVTELQDSVEGDNPLGVKGVGENATTGAPAAIVNAICDALLQVGDGPGGLDIQMPVRSEQVWQALIARKARRLQR